MTTLHRIGLVGDLAHAARHLLDAGVEPVGGPFAQGTTSQIEEALKWEPETPVLAYIPPDEPGWAPWLKKLVDQQAQIVVVGQPPPGVDLPPWRRLSPDNTLAAAFRAVGASRATIPHALEAVHLDGRFRSQTDQKSPAPTSATVKATPAALEHNPAPEGHEAPLISLTNHQQPDSQQTGTPSSSSQSPSGRTADTQPDDQPASTRPIPTPNNDTTLGKGSIPIVEADSPGPASPGQDPASDPGALFGANSAQAQALAPVVVVFGARGGTGKSSISQALAATGGARGLRTVLVDASPAQGDQQLLLRIPSSHPMPSVYSAAQSGNPADAFSSPELLDRLRGTRRDQLTFALAAAPPTTIAGAVEKATAGLYRQIVDHARRVADLVIIDTHPVNAGHVDDLARNLVLPLLRADGWGLGMTDSTLPGLYHLEQTLEFLTSAGVPEDRLLTVINKVSPRSDLDLESLGHRLSAHSRWLGPIYSDPDDIQDRSNAGVVLSDVHVMAHRVETVLERVVGLEVRTAPPDESRGFLARLRGALPRRGR